MGQFTFYVTVSSVDQYNSIAIKNKLPLTVTVSGTVSGVTTSGAYPLSYGNFQFSEQNF